MKKQIKSVIDVVVKNMLTTIPDKTNKARLLSKISKLKDRNNSVEYVASKDLFWLKSGDAYLYEVKDPYFNFSKQKLYKSIERIACRHYMPKSGDTIVDIGAGIGTEVLFFNEKIGPKGKLYSIEACKSSFERLNDVCEKNGILISKNTHCAITDKNQDIWIEETDTYQTNAINTEAKGVSVNGITLDAFVASNTISKIDFLKVNIEGAELQMLDGMKNSIDTIENIAISCHDFLGDFMPPIKKVLIAFFEKNGFEVFVNNTNHPAVDSWIYGKKRN